MSLVSNPIGTKFKLRFAPRNGKKKGRFKSHRDKVQIIPKRTIGFKAQTFQIPQGQSSNSDFTQAIPMLSKFQIPQGQSSNGHYLHFSFSDMCFKSHRDKVQIRTFYASTSEKQAFQIPQGQSSNASRIHMRRIKRNCFKSHRDKVQIPLLSFLCGFLYHVSNPIGTKFKSSTVPFSSLVPCFKSHRDKVQIFKKLTTFLATQSFKSHRDKVQI